MPDPAPQRLTVLGATGSIGQSTLDVVARHPDRFEVFALSAQLQDDKLLEQCLCFSPRFAVMGDATAAERLRAGLRAAGRDTEVLCGEEALERVAAADEVAMVMAAIGLVVLVAQLRLSVDSKGVQPACRMCPSHFRLRFSSGFNGLFGFSQQIANQLASAIRVASPTPPISKIG